jgi:4-hydroxy-L-threonine phosphate dehydrogenase PdxA
MPAAKPIIAIIPGDCTGIGPEQTARLFSERRARDVARLIYVGDIRVLKLGMRQAGVDVQYRLVETPHHADWDDTTSVPAIDLGNIDPELLPPGISSPESGRLTGDTLAAAIQCAKAGQIDAVTFALLNKQALYKGGWQFPDEHKMFAHLLEHKGLFSEMTCSTING